MKKQLDMTKMAKGLGAVRRGKVHAKGGYLGALGLAADVEARFRVPEGVGALRIHTGRNAGSLLSRLRRFGASRIWQRECECVEVFDLRQSNSRCSCSRRPRSSSARRMRRASFVAGAPARQLRPPSGGLGDGAPLQL